MIRYIYFTDDYSPLQHAKIFLFEKDQLQIQ